MLNFCTLFDSNYLTRGLSLYDSLIKHHSNFHLYIFAFDELALNVLKSLNLKNVTLISLDEFEDEELKSIKNTRSQMEYCWTCTPSVIRYCIQKWNLEICTYLDADIYFFNPCNEIFNEFESSGNDVLITEHRFTKRYEEYKENGIFNVQFMVFRNTLNGMTVLNWWRDRCIEWCYARVEDGKLGDQKYLDIWPEKFEKIHILKYLGGALGPWNIQQYNISQNKKTNNLAVIEKTSNIEFNLIFYHFHNFKFYKNGYARAINYELSKPIIEQIYTSYLNNVLKNYTAVSSKFSFMKNKGFQSNEESTEHIESCVNRGNFDGDNFIFYDYKKYLKINSKPIMKLIKGFIKRKILSLR